MRKMFNINSLFLGKIYICKQCGGNRGYVECKTDNYYIFYKKNNKGEDILNNNELVDNIPIEIYEGENGTNNHIFNTPYIVDTKSIMDYLSIQDLVAKSISKERISEIFELVNSKSVNIDKKLTKIKTKSNQTIA